MHKPVRLAAAVSVLIVALVLLAVPPVAQNPLYHQFADQRTLLGVPNFWNVVSNLPFLLVGIYGLMRRRGTLATGPDFVTFYAVGLICICAGSSWYHLDPSNDSLAWDRLAMTISFMTAFAFVLGSVSAPGIGTKLLWPLIAIGFASVLYWTFTEQRGAGDLRVYGLVQFLPGLIIPFLLLVAAPQFGQGVARWIWLGLAAYVAAKLAEWQDAGLYQLGTLLSGHSIKHLLAALSSYYFLRALLLAQQQQDGA